MNISEQTVKKLAEIINEKSQYRSGSVLVEFFNELGFHDSYGQGFPSRIVYTIDKIHSLNGTSGLDSCIKKIFDPRNFVDDYQLMYNLIEDFNKHLIYDGWNIFLNGNEITFKKVSFNVKDLYTSDSKNVKTESDFINLKIEKIDYNKLPIESSLIPIIQSRLIEIDNCLKSNSPLAAIFLCGSVLEGILFAIANKNQNKFNTANTSPKDKENKVKPFSKWTLHNYIDVAKELGYIDEDVKKFSTSVQDFRNYIHPYQQLMSNFNPTIETAKLCAQVVKIAINQIGASK